jgi:hypothetical protein
VPTLVSHSSTCAATKEPKLQAARRIVAEWPEYDSEVAKFTERARAALAIEEGGKLSQSQADLRTAMGSERDVVSELREEL